MSHTSGPDSGGHRYAHGRRLWDHLRDASQAATRLGEPNISERLDDFAEYAAGEIPLTLLELWYIPERRESDERLMRLLLERGMQRCVEVLGEFVKLRPDATAQDARKWLHRLTRTMERWSIGEDRLGGIKLPRNAADYLTWILPNVAEEIADMPGSELIAQVVQWRRRRVALDRLRATVEDRNSTESDIHTELRSQSWIFGGRYVEELTRRRLTTTDEIDIPLLRGDGSLHVVELKRAVIPNLVEPLRSHAAVGTDVHRAVFQAANYLRMLDESRAAIHADHGIECRPAFATVLIAHPKFLAQHYESAEVAATVRTYNAALNRIEVVTYQELLDAAERTLALDDGK